MGQAEADRVIPNLPDQSDQPDAPGSFERRDDGVVWFGLRGLREYQTDHVLEES